MTDARPRKPDFSGWAFPDVMTLIGDAIASKVAESLFEEIADQFQTIWIERDGPHLWLFDQDANEPYRFPLARMRFCFDDYEAADVDVAIHVIESWLTELRKMKTEKEGRP